MVQKGLTTYFSNSVSEDDQISSVVFTLNERDSGVQWNISKQEGVVKGGDFRERYEERISIEDLRGEDLVVIAKLFDDWLDSDTHPRFDDKLDDVKGEYEKQLKKVRHRSQLDSIEKEFNSLNLSVCEQSFNIEFWDDGEWKGLEIPSAKNIERGQPKDFENVTTISGVFYDFFEKRFSGSLPGFEINSRPVAETTGIDKIERIFNRFGKVHRQLMERSHGKNPLSVDDEYDVQYLLHSLLKLHFDDIRDESYLRQHAGKAPRIDFLIEDKKIGIETKITGSRPPEKIRQELAEDKEHYRSDTRCDTLLCFIYDPERELSNPAEFEKDLSEAADNLTTRVTVTQL